jgi:hypothetical protein
MLSIPEVVVTFLISKVLTDGRGHNSESWRTGRRRGSLFIKLLALSTVEKDSRVELGECNRNSLVSLSKKEGGQGGYQLINLAY